MNDARSSLQSTALPLLIRTPNAKHAAGMGRDNYVPNPGATSPVQADMFVFLGKLMGHVIRSAHAAGTRSLDAEKDWGLTNLLINSGTSSMTRAG